MMYKWIGAILIVAGCGGLGFSLAAAQVREEKLLRQLISALDYMECELQYHLTPLPDLCRQCSQNARGSISAVFQTLSEELAAQIAPDVGSCMRVSLEQVSDLPHSVRNILDMLGRCLGRFDLTGQLKGLEAARGECRRTLKNLTANKEPRLRSLQTLGLCAGAAIAILFI